MAEKFGSTEPFAEPAWYNPQNESPYYTDAHKAFRAKVRQFTEEEVMPHVEEWEKAGEVPHSAFLKAADSGLLPTLLGWPQHMVPYVGERPEGYDGFFTVIALDELCRCASGGVVWGLIGGMSIGLPPVVYSENAALRDKVAPEVLKGEKRIALAVSEATGGSDVANLRTSAEDKGEYWLVNGMKKWITCGMFADYFTVAARTKGEGMMGIELILIDRSLPGVETRPMDCMGVKGSGTAWVEFNDVKVPKSCYIGDVTLLLRNFVTERLGLALQANRFARVCVEESVKYAKFRKAFGKKLVDQPVVRYKIAEMARQVETTHAYLESLAYRIVAVEKSGEDWFAALLRLGAEAALAKVQATKTFDQCARSAAHLQGGNAYVKGNKIESLYRHVLSLSIPGGSEDVMIDAAARLALQGRL